MNGTGNIKLGDVATDVMGLSGRDMLRGWSRGKTTAPGLAEFARGRLRRKRDQLQSALQGPIGQHQRFMLGHLLQHIEFVERQIEQLSAEIEARMRPFEVHMESLQRIPGIGRRSVEAILAEIGVEMRYWPTDEAMASWAKICPGNNESAGKRRSTSIGRGNQSLRSALVEATLAAIRVKDSYFSSLYHRVASRRGAKRAIIAVAHAILIVIYHMLSCAESFSDDYGTTSPSVVVRTTDA